MTEKQKAKRVRAIADRWLRDREFFEQIAVRPEPQFGDVEEILRNLGTAIAYAEAYCVARS